MISDPNQTPDPSANYTDKNTELDSDPWADSSDEPQAEAPREEIAKEQVNAKEAPVLNLKPKSEMAASVSEESNWEDEDDESSSDPVEEVRVEEVRVEEVTVEEVRVEEVTAEEVTAVETTEPEPTEAEAIQAELTNESIDRPEEEEADRLSNRVAELRRQKAALEAEILELEANRGQLLQENVAELQNTLGQMIQDSLGELQQRKQALQISVEQLERRQDRIRKEMQTTFAGVSQDLAIRVQGFKDYLVGSLQDLVTAAEELEMAPKQRSPEPAPEPMRSRSSGQRPPKRSGNPQFGEGNFEEKAQQIRRVLKQFRTQPDYYGPPWQLRRTFEPIHAERVSNWFFTQGGRGALRSMGSRLQNILVASAVMSCLRKIYGNRFRTLVLADSPERLGEWRRGLQDCLGISRSDFGPERGVVLFEDPTALSQKAERLVKDGLMPLILIDETEGNINLGVLQFPLWLAFAAEPKMAAASSSNW